jgi:hypothetical protein
LIYQTLNEAQLKQQIDAEQAFSAWQDAATKSRDFAGGMHWKTVAGKEYLYKSLDRKGNAKSLGVRSDASEAIEQHFHAQKALYKSRIQSLVDTLATHSKINAALRLGSAPSIVAELCTRLHSVGLMGRSLMIIGTNSLFAYEAMAGVRFARDILATTDIDLLWDHKARVRLAMFGDAPDGVMEPGLLAILQKVDKSFQIVQGQGFRAANDKGYMVDLIRQMPNPPWKDDPDRFFSGGDLIATDIWNMKWLLNAPRIHQTAIALNGAMFPICAPDPRAYAMFKLWLGESDERNPLKKSRDLAQARALAALIKDKLPHLIKNWHNISSFPADIAPDTMEKLLSNPS